MLTRGLKRAKIGILVGTKGRGSNMEAIAQACLAGDVPAEVRVVVGANPQCEAIKRATALGLSTHTIQPDDNDLIQALSGCDWVCLAGYLRLLPPTVLERFPNRVLNIHPSLLPKFGGKGMYGLRVHEAVIAAGEPETGCTVHRVTANYDEGEIVVQVRCPVFPDDTPQTLAARVLELEHLAYPKALRKVLT